VLREVRGSHDTRPHAAVIASPAAFKRFTPRPSPVARLRSVSPGRPAAERQSESDVAAAPPRSGVLAGPGKATGPAPVAYATPTLLVDGIKGSCAKERLALPYFCRLFICGAMPPGDTWTMTTEYYLTIFLNN